eukprot:473621-Rhodomonas_salina.1
MHVTKTASSSRSDARQERSHPRGRTRMSMRATASRALQCLLGVRPPPLHRKGKDKDRDCPQERGEGVDAAAQT